MFPGLYFSYPKDPPEVDYLANKKALAAFLFFFCYQKVYQGQGFLFIGWKTNITIVVSELQAELE